MAYWLSNTSTLLFLIQESLKPGSAVGATPIRKPQPATSLFGRMAMVLELFIVLIPALKLFSFSLSAEILAAVVLLPSM